MERVDKEVSSYGEYSSRSEFVVDAVKYYLDYKLRMRIDEEAYAQRSATGDVDLPKPKNGGRT